MRLEDADVVADLLRQTQQVSGRVHVSRHAQVGPLDVDQTQQVGGEGGEVGLFGPFTVRLEEGVVALGHGGHDEVGEGEALAAAAAADKSLATREQRKAQSPSHIAAHGGAGRLMVPNVR